MKEKTVYYNIHNIVKIKICTSIERIHYEALVHLREFESGFIEEDELDIVINSYDKREILLNPIVISDYYYYNDNWMDIPNQNICFNINNKKIEVFINNFQISINFLVEVILLRKGYSMIHSAGFSINNKSYMIPTFGGVGKTITLSKFVAKGAKIYGDDIIIIKKNEIYSYPIDFSIYPYHIEILNLKIEEAEKTFKKTKVINKIQDKFANKGGVSSKVINLGLNYLKKSYLPISPNRIFGGNVIQHKGNIDKVIYLLKQDITDENIKITNIEPKLLARISANILMSEWHASYHLMQIYSGLSDFSIDMFKDNIRRIFEDSFKSTTCNKVILPAKLPVDDYIKQFEDRIMSKN